MKVLVVDDSATVREELEAMLSEITEPKNIIQAKDALEATSSFHELNPYVVKRHIRIPAGNGIDVLQQIGKGDRPPLAIVLTNYPYLNQ
jgi:DNA-binding NarL/FixJ family response regulator